jgi:hypothetical protein
MLEMHATHRECLKLLGIKSTLKSAQARSDWIETTSTVQCTGSYGSHVGAFPLDNIAVLGAIVRAIEWVTRQLVGSSSALRANLLPRIMKIRKHSIVGVRVVRVEIHYSHVHVRGRRGYTLKWGYTFKRGSSKRKRTCTSVALRVLV